ncbi:radical SAM protein [Sansalvadorimonas verongulae]|uniref:radical SAM protein n=1 Tax=Sansalvadorimonas verongulae TaxID=2172824 RepID=UPI0012BD659B|nr:radical SAM protein [Sansalvadorimonas verongulae]MTI15000.1 radical SAM protein [Sansalvadorimonas verongulae]
MKTGQFNNNDYVSVTMEFRCNLKCEHCMIEGTMDRLVPQTLQRFHEILTFNREHKQWKGLILTGSEITLRKDLPELARQAKEAGFQHVRIQTHGMHLHQKSYCDTLLDAGIDEFFVSVAGSDAESHDRITGMIGAFDRMMQGLRYLDSFGHVSLLTNTVVTASSYQLLPELVASLSHLKRLQQMEFWAYWPMQETDEKDLLVPHAQTLPYLKAAIAKAWEQGRSVEVKNFPECMLGDMSDVLMNDQPELHIDPAFWDEFMRNGFYQCTYQEQCHSKQCLGLNSAYIKKYGWEKSLLSPVGAAIAPTNLPWEEQKEV